MVRAAEETGCDMVIADFYRVVGEMILTFGSIGTSIKKLLLVVP